MRAINILMKKRFKYIDSEIDLETEINPDNQAEVKAAIEPDPEPGPEPELVLEIRQRLLSRWHWLQI